MTNQIELAKYFAHAVPDFNVTLVGSFEIASDIKYELDKELMHFYPLNHSKHDSYPKYNQSVITEMADI